jgi:hypothetical protein
VAKFAIRVFERSSSISAWLRTGGLVAAASDIRLVIFLLQQQQQENQKYL